RYIYTIYGGGGINFQRPSYTFVKDDKIYVADTNNGRVAVFNYEGRYSRGFGSSGPGKLIYPVSVTVLDNKVLVADVGTKKIHVYDMEGKFAGYFAEGLINAPCSIFYKDKQVFAVDKGLMEVVVFDSNGNKVRSFGGKGMDPGKFYYPYSVYVSDDNKVYVADSNNNRIQVFRPDGSLLQILNGQDLMEGGRYSVPRGTAFDKDGNLYTAEGLINSVSVTNKEGLVTGRFRYAEPRKRDSKVTDAINLPTSVFIDDRGRLYVTEFGKSRVLVYQL
ncbi:MAG TPA: 6-bladed beta-propeller, partial [Desulfobacteria bacterium]|nr:6-bladed beta-propeller [Desulfobacteria bacterium]